MHSKAYIPPTDHCVNQNRFVSSVKKNKNEQKIYSDMPNRNSMTNYSIKDGLTNDFAQSIFEDKNGELWFGMADGNIFKCHGKHLTSKFKKNSKAQ